ncbi:pro-sigmaK processing inhibitor BofA family protein [Ferroacidibacillus organovorans]|uniref:Pro-sigmaK processing inhibitor BofA n=1 Tax=Ferroacidibacillus organovorans TaxID=1765683 RepID=A0A168C3K8_9BACL|nr:pro-sigmaK processing inhibitor BofA family protein [Ferroacidibacillus organovorans]KYP81515.1 hypothetical protein AYJ22_07225 [Ferroacidibacillus organovorans]OAG94051.1 hypothetical protein AYW79_07420 [Ferroacidibacillus organovorans]OPG16872.1 hypothetical protein B2M26_04520 [Ferroacidibacillus organovorans]
MPAYQIWLILAGGVVLLLLLRSMYRDPSRYVVGLLKNVILGGAVYVLINNTLRTHGFHIPLNWGTVAVTGILGVPGIAALTVIDHWLL